MLDSNLFTPPMTAGGLATCCIVGGHRPPLQRRARHHAVFVQSPKELNAGYWALRVAFGFGPLLAGLDKFTNILVYVEHGGEFREAA